MKQNLGTPRSKNHHFLAREYTKTLEKYQDNALQYNNLVHKPPFLLLFFPRTFDCNTGEFKLHVAFGKTFHNKHSTIKPRDGIFATVNNVIATNDQ